MSTDPARKPLSVLLVEDSPLDGRLLLEALRPAMTGGEVVVQTVKRLGAAVEELKRFSFSCVLLDLGLPDGRGVGNVTALREVDKKAAIIVLTGLDDEHSAAETVKLGAQDYLIKGETDGEKMMKLIRRAVQRNRQTVQLETARDQGFFDASRDPLTALPNRALFLDRARMQLAEARGRDGEFGLVCLMIEGLDETRSQYGPVIADDLLRRLSQTLGESLKASDTLARLDTGLFALLLNPLREPGVLLQAAEQLVQRVRAVRQVGNCQIQLTPRAGVALLGVEDTLEALIESAIERAKSVTGEHGGAAGLAKHGAAPVPVPANLRVLNTVFAERWQPWFDISTGRCAGLELLPTWPEVARPFYDPNLTPPLAAELALAAVDTLAKRTQNWRAARFEPELVSLKLPVAALRQADFASRLHAVLSQRGLAPGLLQLEIGEAAFREPNTHLASLLALHGEGYRLVFSGDGSSDLSLRQFTQAPLDACKLSRGLLRLLMEESLQGSSRRFIEAVLGAAQSLGIRVIATGVESKETYAALRLIGVHLMQGEALAPPMEPEQMPLIWNRPLSL